MATVTTGYPHIRIDEKGVPVIDDTTMKVVELVREHLLNLWSPEALKIQHPYLSLGQIYSALGYYWDHKEELDRDIAARDAYAEKMQRNAPESPLPARLRAAGLLETKTV